MESFLKKIFVKIFSCKNFSQLKISKIWSLLSANTYLGFQGPLSEDYCLLKADSESQIVSCVYLSTVSSPDNFSKAVIGL